jgi:hypothetical protein
LANAVRDLPLKSTDVITVLKAEKFLLSTQSNVYEISDDGRRLLKLITAWKADETSGKFPRMPE